MIIQPHNLPPKPATSLSTPAYPDVQWCKPVFRAPDLSAKAMTTSDLPFTIHRVTETRRTAR